MSTLVQQVFQGNVVNNTMELTKGGQCYQTQGFGEKLYDKNVLYFCKLVQFNGQTYQVNGTGKVFVLGFYRYYP